MTDSASLLKSRFGPIAGLSVLLVLGGCKNDVGGGGANPSPSPSAGDVVTIEIVDSTSFSPDPATVSKGQRFRWRNGDTTTHSAVLQSFSGFDTGKIAPSGTSISFTMSSTGTFSYACTVPSGYTGTLQVR
ncbi:MAG TPA: hypothetical protein VMT70_07725 [Vicinamibacteria bacterium]|nr:hypothetical protein [Vicinamibacteria bacterium]